MASRFKSGANENESQGQATGSEYGASRVESRLTDNSRVPRKSPRSFSQYNLNISNVSSAPVAGSTSTVSGTPSTSTPFGAGANAPHSRVRATTTGATAPASVPTSRSHSFHSSSLGVSTSSTASAQFASASTSSSSSSLTNTALMARRNSPQEIGGLVEKLVRKIVGVTTSVTTRRYMARLAEAPSPKPIDTMILFEKMKRRINSDPFFYDNPDVATGRLHTLYSRLLHLKPMNKKSEALFLLLNLMNSTDPGNLDVLADAPTFASTNVAPDIALTPLHGNGLPFVSQRNPTSSLSDPLAEVSARRRTAQLAEGASGPIPMEVDALEDSFRFAMGLAASQAISQREEETGSSQKPTRSDQQIDRRLLSNLAVSSANSMDIPEEVLLSEVLYALQAIDSQYLYFDTTIDRFRITRSVGVPSPTRSLVYKLCELGWLYRKVFGYLKFHREELSFGLVGQSFCHALDHELSDYYRLIAVLSPQINEHAAHRTIEKEPTGCSNLTLRKLVIWTQDPLDKLRLMARMIDSVEGLRGGALASGIHSHILHGDPSVSRFVEMIMRKVTLPIFRMIGRWIQDGELDDPHGEFFVVGDPSVPNEQLWSRKYKLRSKMLPTFISVELAKKILVIGKTINFIRQCCGNTEDLSQSIEYVNDLRFGDMMTLESTIEKASAVTNASLIQCLMEKYQLLDHCRAFKRYLLMGQGDFIQYLMDLVGKELSKRATQVFRHNLTNALETALNSSNAKFESADILARLDVKLLQPSSGDDGWDVFSLHYKVSPPISTVINEHATNEYLRIFHFLWRLKRVEYSLSSCWCRDMNLGHFVRDRVPDISYSYHKSHWLRSEMIHFITNLHSYMMFEVLETSWHKLIRDLKAAKGMDELIQSHDEYLLTIKRNAFMQDDSRDLLAQLKLVFDIIIKFCKIQEMLYTAGLREVHEHKVWEETIKSRTLKGQWGIPNQDMYKDNYAFVFHQNNERVLMQVDQIAEEYKIQFMKFIEMVQQRGSSTHNLPFLVSRFDFNEYYRRDMYATEEETKVGGR